MGKKRLFFSSVTFIISLFVFLAAFSAVNYKLIVDNKTINTVLLKEYNKKVYIALGDFLKYNGFSVTWDSKLKKVIAKRSKDQYEFYVNQRVYYINKVKKTLNESIILEKGKTYILGKDISTILQYSYSEDRNKKTITLKSEKMDSISKDLTSRFDSARSINKNVYLTDIRYTIEDNTFLLYIKASSSMSYKVTKLKNPDRIVIDIPNVIDNLSNNVISVGKGGIYRIRHALNKTDKEIFSRVVIDYDESLIKTYKIQKSTNQLEVIISLPISIDQNTNIDDASLNEESDPISNNTGQNSSNKDNDINQNIGSPILFNFQNISIKNTQDCSILSINVNSSVLSEVYRADENFVALNIKNAQFDTSSGTVYNVNNGAINYLLAQNLDNNNVQILIATNSKYFAVSKQNNLLNVIFSNNYGTLKTDDNGNVVLDSVFVNDIIVSYDSNDNVIKLKSKGLISILDDVYKLKDSNVLISVYETYENDMNVINIKISSNYMINKTSNGNLIMFMISKKPQPKKKLRIFIDPGHGGKDSGAVYEKTINGKSVKYNEKDLNLDISLRLRDRLRSMGYEVYISREQDKYVDLYERTNMANSINADLFISIHNNSIENNKQARGTTVLYNPNDNSNSFISNKEFAQIVLDYIIKKVGTKNNGIMARPNLAVLRTSNMPSVLVEVAFGSNEDDLNLLLQDSFKNNVAQAIAEAVDYININYSK